MAPRPAPLSALRWLVPILIAWALFMGLGPHSELPHINPPLAFFDVSWRGYDGPDALKIIETLGEHGRQVYLLWHFPFDMVFPVLYGGTLFVLLRWLAQANGIGASPGRLITALPLVAIVGDWAENILVLSMILPVPPQVAVAPLASVFTQAKILAIALSLLAAIVLGLRLMLRGQAAAEG